MLRFGKASSEPLGDPRSAERWLASLPVNDPIAAQQGIVAAIQRLTARTTRRTPPMLEAVFAVDVHAQRLVRTLVGQYVEHASRSAKIEDQLWHALFDLSRGFQECYAAFARDVADEPPRGRWQALLQGLIGRQIVHMRHDAKLRLFRCERWVASKWSELFGAFTRACAHRIEREPLRLDPMGDATTIEREFLMTLLLQLADPGNLLPKEIEWIATQLDAWCRPLRFTLRPTSAMMFYVDVAGTTGLRRRPLAPLEGRVLFVDLEPLHALLVQNQAVLEQAARAEKRPDAASPHRAKLELLAKIANRINPEFRPLTRRGERKPASGAVDAIVGLAGISAFLRRNEGAVSSPIEIGRSFGNTMELATFGRNRVEARSGQLPEYGQLAAYTAPGGPWEMKDVSASGFRLHAPMSVATELTLNMLVAISRREQSGWVVGIVRRMRRLTTQDAEIGLQLIANEVTSADLFEQRKARAADYSVGNEDPAMTGRPFHGLFLAFARREGEPPVHSLIVPATEYYPSRQYALRVGNTARTIRFGRLLEQHPDWVWVVIDSASPEPGGTGTGPRR
jgi:hypothetical protein